MTVVKRYFRAVALLLCTVFLISGCVQTPSPVLSASGESSSSDTESDGACVESTTETSEDPVESSVDSPETSQYPSETSMQSASSKTPATSKAPVQSTQSVQSKAPSVSSQAPVSSKAPSTSSAVSREVRVTITEGSTFMQIATLLEQKGVCSKRDFYNICQTYTPKSFTISTSTDRCFRMEGYLFPDTYTFYKNDNPQNVLIKMLNNYHAKVGNLSEDTLILASIIEKEARSDEHMKLVSSVFHNRLNNLTKFPYLDADPTRDYVNNFITGNALVSNPGKYAVLYNTCQKRRGLPAGPICNPGIRAIRAAQNPTSTSYFYFFYGKDGNNHYSETLEEHDAQIAQYGIG